MKRDEVLKKCSKNHFSSADMQETALCTQKLECESIISAVNNNKIRKLNERRCRETFQFEILLHGNRKTASRTIKLSDVWLNIHIAKLDEIRFRVTIRIRNLILKKIKMLETRCCKVTRIASVILGAMKDCTALRAYTCNLRLKCIRNKKMLSRLNKMRLQTYPEIKNLIYRLLAQHLMLMH
jgi:hypothetical protein